MSWMRNEDPVFCAFPADHRARQDDIDVPAEVKTVSALIDYLKRTR